ncbi:mannosyltransferase family protein [Micromonospora arborensis]|uniref:mannosyltransferase family protein n=1 Tax=Micromonospora arborensis TaxID=2116518 RepID=UPI00371310B4
MPERMIVETSPAQSNASAGDSGPALSPESPVRAGMARWRGSVIAGFWTWFASLLAYALVTYLSWIPYYQVPSRSGPPPASLPSVLELWHQWDTNWYVIIATSGYEWAPTQAPAFYPLYPGLVRILNPVLPGDALLAALTVSAACALAALILLHRLALDVFGETGGSDARRAIFYLMAFPAGFYLIAGYTESLFIALSVASLYCMRHQRWWWAGGIAAFATATRATGAMLAFAFAFEYLRQTGAFRDPKRLARIRWNASAICLVPVGILSYAAYCWHKFGDPLVFVKAQEHWGRKGFTPPWESLARTVAEIVRADSIFSHNAHHFMNLGAALGALLLVALAVFGPWKLGEENLYLAVFSFLMVLVPLSSPLATSYPLGSMIRYVLPCLSAVLVLAKMGRNVHFDRVFVAAAMMAQGVLLLAFLHDQFVA